MPTENEMKFILNYQCEEDVKKISKNQYKISQGYLIATRGITVRIRKSEMVSKKTKDEYFFTLKVSTAGRVIEIEKKLDERDFNDLWAIALNKLEKIRFIVENNNDEWEIDFFKDYLGKTYMAVAELEMPENQMEPNSLPIIVKNNLIYKVPLTDTRFSNKLLGDARYATELLQTILKQNS